MEVFFPFSLIERLRMGECGMRLLRSGADTGENVSFVFHGTEQIGKTRREGNRSVSPQNNHAARACGRGSQRRGECGGDAITLVRGQKSIGQTGPF